MPGIVAVFVVLGFALVKFLATVHMRHLMQRRLRMHNDLQKITKRLSSVEGNLQVERSSQTKASQQIVAAKRLNAGLHQRLLLELPDRLQSTLRLCIDRNPVPETTGVKLFHELNLGEKIAESLSDLSVAVFKFPTDDAAASAVLKGEFIQALEKTDVRYSTGDSSLGLDSGPGEKPADFDFVVCAFNGPVAALDLLRRFIEDLGDDRVTQVHGALVSGIEAVADNSEGVIGRFARSLERSQKLAGAAPPGTLLLNEAAYDRLRDYKGVHLLSASEGLFAFSWRSPAGKAEQPADDSGVTSAAAAGQLQNGAGEPGDEGGPVEQAGDDPPEVESRT